MSPSKEPFYAHIAKDLAQGIASGKYLPDTLLPTEMELCEQYQASRHTVRAALRELTDIGLVSRRKHVGTRVERTQTAQGQAHSLASLDDLMTLAQTNMRVVKKVEEIVADAQLAKVIGGKPGVRWLHIASIREDEQQKDLPICMTDSYVSASYSEIGKLVRKDPFALISDLIEQQYGRRSVEVRQTIAAVAISPQIAKILNAEVGTPALKIVRSYVDRLGKIFETTVSIHPAERYTCSIVLKRNAPNESLT